jgi:hypothetical protein
MIKIEEREILVNSAWISLQTDSVIVIEIDCKSKYAQVCGYSQNSFALCADENTLHKGTVPGYTDIEFDLPDGFCIGSISTGRYDVRAYCVNEKLMRQQEVKMIWETDRK